MFSLQSGITISTTFLLQSNTTTTVSRLSKILVSCDSFQVQCHKTFYLFSLSDVKWLNARLKVCKKRDTHCVIIVSKMFPNTNGVFFGETFGENFRSCSRFKDFFVKILNFGRKLIFCFVYFSKFPSIFKSRKHLGK